MQCVIKAKQIDSYCCVQFVWNSNYVLLEKKLSSTEAWKSKMASSKIDNILTWYKKNFGLPTPVFVRTLIVWAAFYSGKMQLLLLLVIAVAASLVSAEQPPPEEDKIGTFKENSFGITGTVYKNDTDSLRFPNFTFNGCIKIIFALNNRKNFNLCCFIYHPITHATKWFKKSYDICICI